jgi:hypothetical protein
MIAIMVRHFIMRPRNVVVSTAAATKTGCFSWVLPSIVIIVPAILWTRQIPGSGVMMDYLWNGETTNANGLFLGGGSFLLAISIALVLLLLLLARSLFGSNKTISSSPTTGATNNRSQEPAALILSVFPAGVQLSRTSTSASTLTENGIQQQRHPTLLLSSSFSLPPLYFLPRTEIVDVIVQEVIWSYKVTSVLFFRVNVTSTTARSTKEDNNNNNFNRKSSSASKRLHQQQQQTTLRLVEVFPGVELLYMECLMLRGEILKALGIIDK